MWDKNWGSRRWGNFAEMRWMNAWVGERRPYTIICKHPLNHLICLNYVIFQNLLWGIKRWRRWKENNFDGLNSFSVVSRLVGSMLNAVMKEGESALKATVKFLSSVAADSLVQVLNQKNLFISFSSCMSNKSKSTFIIFKKKMKE